MDQKSWLLKKRSTADNSFTNGEETEEQEQEQELRMSITEEAIAGWESAKKEAISLKKEVDKVSREKGLCEERLRQVDAALKECMQQLHFVRHKQDMKASEESEKARIARLDGENRAVSGKEKVVDELRKYSKNEKHLCNIYMGTQEMKLMDDFAEMEKLVLDYPAATQSFNLESNVSIPVGKSSIYMENTYSSVERYENDQNPQLQSHTNKEGQADASRMQLRNDWEITTASEKLAECQETLLNLGKQLKALTSLRPGEAAIFDNVISTPADHVITSTSTPSKVVSKRFSLQDKMIEEDKVQTITSSITTDEESWSKFTKPNGIDHEADKTAIVSMAIVPRKKSESTSLLKKLFLWKTKGNRKKTPPLKQH